MVIRSSSCPVNFLFLYIVNVTDDDDDDDDDCRHHRVITIIIIIIIIIINIFLWKNLQEVQILSRLN
jgi:hypothetical protein